MLSDVTARSQVRFGNLEPVVDPPVTLVDLDTIKQFFGIKDTAIDDQLMSAAAIVTAVIRTNTGRYLNKGSYVETFTDVNDQKPERYLVETPVINILPPQNVAVPEVATLMQGRTGRVLLTAGPVVDVIYEGGYDPLPYDLLGVFYELVRQQMGIWGFETLGVFKPYAAPAEKSVTVGSLKVEYAVSANSLAARANSGSPLSEEALMPYEAILSSYRSYRRLVAT